MKKVILISGGSDGLGRELAKLLAPDHDVVILSSDADKLQAVALELGCDFETADVTKLAELRRAVDSVVAKHGRIDCLVNNAGIFIEGPLDTNDPEVIHKVLEVNTLGTIWLTRLVLPVLKAQKSGRIINVVSQGGLTVKADRSVYYASKWAITGFTKSLALELAPLGIPVSGFYPGGMQTHLFERAGITKDTSKMLPVSEAAAALAFMVLAPDKVNISEIGIQTV